MKLTDASKKLFEELVKDAPNWGGNPQVDVSPTERGNLTQLKRAKLITTAVDPESHIAFAAFTTDGKELATEMGLSAYLEE